MLRLPPIIALGAALGLLSVPADAEDEEHMGAHHAEYPNLVGVRVGLLSVFEREEGGTPYERVIVHDWLEMELSVPVATLGREEPNVVMPMDLHAKLPFHPDPSLSPCVAAGLALDVVLRPDVEVFGGVSFAVGTYVWSSERIRARLRGRLQPRLRRHARPRAPLRPGPRVSVLNGRLLAAVGLCSTAG